MTNFGRGWCDVTNPSRGASRDVLVPCPEVASSVIGFHLYVVASTRKRGNRGRVPEHSRDWSLTSFHRTFATMEPILGIRNIRAAVTRQYICIVFAHLKIVPDCHDVIIFLGKNVAHVENSGQSVIRIFRNFFYFRLKLQLTDLTSRCRRLYSNRVLVFVTVNCTLWTIWRSGTASVQMTLLRK